MKDKVIKRTFETVAPGLASFLAHGVSPNPFFWEFLPHSLVLLELSIMFPYPSKYKA